MSAEDAGRWLLYAGSDRLVNPAGSRAFAAAAPPHLVTARAFELVAGRSLADLEESGAVMDGALAEELGRFAGRTVRALAYVAEPGHVQFAGKLLPEVVLERVATSAGSAGRNVDYVLSTVDHLRALGCRDRPLERLADAIRRRLATTP